MVLPMGTVTLLFSDMEGSTRLLSRLGDRYVAALDAQRAILRAAWRHHNGTELGTEGDSFFVAFAEAGDAVAAAVEGQRDLESAVRGGGERVLVRMGIHTGAPLVHDDGYVGMDVHRAARISAAAHGGQIVVSEATAALLPHNRGLTLTDLGRHTLKDLPQPEHLFQVCADGLRAQFPPLRSLGSAASLPVSPTPLVGRRHEIEQLEQLFLQDGVRLVTLTGPGGIGKTALATEVARGVLVDFADGTWLIELSVLTDPGLVTSAVAAALGLQLGGETISPEAVARAVRCC